MSNTNLETGEEEFRTLSLLFCCSYVGFFSTLIVPLGSAFQPKSCDGAILIGHTISTFAWGTVR